MIKIEFTGAEWRHVVSVIHLNSLKGDKQSKRLLQKLLQRRNEQQDYQCGDDCKGECSGEVDGVVHCPYNPQEIREKVLGEISVRAKRLRAGNFKSEVGENNILDWIIKVCEELRQSKDGEP